ncbi:DUF2298 domain-containing protein [Halobium salinum]|uniref:DUF2298 domain-containing protein n=1 Tax=Halobium salinum TaxID=1364940 RepID=A0ABD5PCZ5_9EURY|nr:DUF2298 domain-containing protein [Halobium salinum]
MEYVLVLQWLLVVAALATLALPVTTRLFESLPGRGAGFALPVALVAVTTVVYWVGHLSYGPTTALFGVLALAAVAGVLALDTDALRDRRVELRTDLGVDRTAVAEAAAVFLVGFLFVLAIRAADPAVYARSGEKFLDFGLLKSLSRADRLPPEDMWFAGEAVSYYYGGHLVTSTLSLLSGVPPAVAYNLGLATFYGALVAAAYELAGSVAAVRRGSRRLAGALAVFFVGVASNLVTGGRLLAVALAPASRKREVARVVAEASPQLTTADVLAGADSFFYWHASRVIPGTINEFPLFGWLNGDLHAHMMGTPFLLLGAGVAFAYFLTPETDTRRRWALLFGVLPVVGGFQVVTDTWSFPSIFGVAWLALLFAPADPLTLLPGGLGGRLRRTVGVADVETEAPTTAADRDGRREERLRTDGDAAVTATTTASGDDDWLAGELVRLVGATAVAAAATGLATLLGLSFLLGAGGGSSREVALVALEMRSPLGNFLLVHGTFLVAFAAYLFGRLDTDRPGLVALAVGAFAALAFGQGLAAVAVALPLLVGSWLALRMGRAVGFEAVLIAAGAGLVMLVELVYVKEQAGPGRMNTVFKTYMQVWVLWGSAMGVVLAGLVDGQTASTARTAAGASGRWRPSGRTRRLAAVGFVGLLVVTTSAYGVLALGSHFQGARMETLDATAFADRQHPEDAEAIRWLDDREGRPVLLSAPGTAQYPTADGGSYPYPPGMYNWNANPASSLTGLPTVAGWAHEVGYRGPDAYWARANAVDRAYTGSTADRVALLREYDVQYVWVGPAERARYGEDVSFADVPGASVAYETETVTVYAVDHERLPQRGVVEAGSPTPEPASVAAARNR